MYKIARILLVGVISSIFIISIILAVDKEEPEKDYYNKVFSNLSKIRDAKKSKIIEYFNNIQDKAFGIKNDKDMHRYFNNFHNNRNNDKYLEYELDKHYVLNYGNFYDILFIDKSGYIFHSIKKESDYNKNLFEGPLSNTKLSNNLRNIAEYQFVDYEYYLPSDEPAAFFVTPVYKDNEHTGWFILQCAINNLNAILTDVEDLGRTLEVYLVNHEKLMLSESRFIEDNTILKLEIDTRAVKLALEENKGESIIKDYRDVTVLSSFEKFEYFGSTWMIIAEIDEDEIVSDLYKKHKKFFQKQLRIYYANQREEKHYYDKHGKYDRKIDMNEFGRGGSGDVLFTYGVSTCTGVAVSYKNKFGYLAHISPTDRIYDESVFAELLEKGMKTDLIGALIKRIKYYDIYPSEMEGLSIVIVANHFESLKNLTDRLLDQGLKMSNIKFIYNSSAIGANIYNEVSDSKVVVEWYSDRILFYEYSLDYPDLGEIIKQIYNQI